MNICIFGAGPGAMAMACHVMEAGHKAGICELPAFERNLDALREGLSIDARGMLSGRYTLEFAATDVEECLSWSDAVIVVTHAAAHRETAAYCAKHLTDRIPVILCPGYVGGGWYFGRLIDAAAPAANIGVVECSVLPFACRKPDGRTVSIHGVKRRFMVSGCGGESAKRGIGLFEDLFEGIVVSPHPVEAGLNETNFVLHASIALLNIGYVQGATPWTFYRQGLTEAVGRLIESVDAERLALMRRLRLRPVPLKRWMLDFYGDQGMSGDTIHEVMHTFPPFADSKGPLSLSHRYFSEDIPFGLVPMSSLAKRCGIETPLTDALIDLADCVCQENYRNLGRDLSDFDMNNCTGP